jgi:hypothetical protein
VRRPPRVYRSVLLVCGSCGKPIRPSEFGSWTHVRRLKLFDPDWHLAIPESAPDA